MSIKISVYKHKFSMSLLYFPIKIILKERMILKDTITRYNMWTLFDPDLNKPVTKYL